MDPRLRGDDGAGAPSAADRSAAFAGDRDDARPWLRARSVGPVAARLSDCAALARMLDAEEQRFGVRRELAAADFRADGPAHELLQTAALRTFGRADPAAVVRAARLIAVADHP